MVTQVVMNASRVRLPDDLEQRRHLEICVGKLGVSSGYEAAGEPQDRGGGDHAEPEE